MWGSNDNGKLGFAQAVNLDREIPTKHEFFDLMRVKQVYLGLNNTFVTVRSNDLFVFGASSFGKIGIPKSSNW